MSFQADNMILENILNELDNYKRPKKELFSSYVKNRLNNSLLVYYKELQQSYDYLIYKNEFRLARNLNKYDTYKDE